MAIITGGLIMSGPPELSLDLVQSIIIKSCNDVLPKYYSRKIVITSQLGYNVRDERFAHQTAKTVMVGLRVTTELEWRSLLINVILLDSHCNSNRLLQQSSNHSIPLFILTDCLSYTSHSHQHNRTTFLIDHCCFE